tara:strand:- start:897 stop:1673 length:777 start_codon:yes stop_codon:yes gene_type:complete
MIGSFRKSIIFSQNALPFVKLKGYNYKYKLKFFIQKVIHTYSIKKSKNVIFTSKFQKNLVLKNINSSKINSISIYHGINNISLKRKFSKKIEKFLCVSEINLYKNQKILFDVFSSLNKKGYNLTLHLYGKNPGNFKPHNKNIKIFKFRNQKILSKIYSKYDAFIFPSKVEAFGLPLIEAARSCLPICCSNLTIFTELLEKKNLIIFNNEKKDIEKKIIKLINLDKKKIKEIINSNYKKSLNYNWNCSSELFFNFVNRV